jgi:predicted Zn-dependent peptidase
VSGNQLVKVPEYPHVCLGFPAASAADNDYFAFRVIKQLFGGSRSFSSEGLGSGQRSLLITGVMNRSWEVEAAHCEHSANHTDGLLGIRVQAERSFVDKVLGLVKGAVRDAHEASSDAVEMAKELAVTSYLRAIDKSEKKLQEFAKQNLWFGEAKDAAGVVERIREVTREETLAAIKKCFAVAPATAVIGAMTAEQIAEIWHRS